MGVLALLDYVARTPSDPTGTSLLYLALASALGAAYAAITDWNHLGAGWRIAPALGGLVAVVGAILWARTADTANAEIGLAVAAVLILAYVGFVLPPGSALIFAPFVVGALLLAWQSNSFRVSLALPIVAVSVAALLGELISALTDRALRTASRFTSRKERLTRLEDVLRRFSRPGSLEEAAHEVALAAIEIFEVDRATVVLRDTEGGLIPVTLGPSSDEEPDAETAQLVAETIGGDEPRLVPTGPSAREQLLVLPLPAADVPAGAVVVHPLQSDDPEFSIDLARLFGTQVGIAIEHLFVIDELERATTRDELTGIGNRKHAEALLSSLEEGDALILLDLDGFKSVNDTLGHAAGDQVLQDLSAHLRHCVRDSDTSARLGGDEFLIVARRAFSDPLAVADRILIGWSNSGRSTTISAGVALHESSSNADDTFDRADKALYQAKAAGKNRAHMWYPGAAPRRVNGARPTEVATTEVRTTDVPAADVPPIDVPSADGPTIDGQSHRPPNGRQRSGNGSGAGRAQRPATG
ncbi:MAG: diguanylate cyclase [Actinomycetota bacterium]